MIDLGADLFGGGLVDFDPGFISWLEDLGESEGAFSRVGAEFGLPDDGDVVVGVGVRFFRHGVILRVKTIHGFETLLFYTETLS